jgi:hypothetical protein
MTFFPLHKHKTCNTMLAIHVAADMSLTVPLNTAAPLKDTLFQTMLIWKIKETHTPKIL